MEVQVNYLAVLLAAVASMGVGLLWYSPVMFAKPWMKLMGHTEKSMEAAKDQMGKTYGMSFALALVTAYVLSHVMTFSMSYMQTMPVATGLSSAFWMWLGFVMPIQATEVLFGGKSWKLFKINTGYQLASLLAMGVVLALMR